MNRFLKILMLSIFAVFLCIGSAWATPVVDGVFHEYEYSSVFSEDDDDSGFVGPGVGGQDYDVEYLGLSIVGSTLYFGLQAGLPLSWSDREASQTSIYQDPGDLAIDIGNDGTWDFGIRFWGETIEVLEATGEWQHVAYDQHNVSDPWRVNSGTVLTSLDDTTFDIAFADTEDKDGRDSYSLEGYINLSLLGWEEGMSVASHFTTYCGNDYAETSVPEPATMLLLGIGLIGMAGIGRKKFK